VGSYSVVWSISHWKEHSGWGLHCSSVCQPLMGRLSIVELPMLACGRERLWLWLWFHPYMWLSSITLLPRLPGFPPPAFPTMISSLTSPWSVSPQSTAAPPWDCSIIPKLQLPAAAHSRRPVFLSRICIAIHMAIQCQGLSDLIPFRFQFI